MNPHFDGAITRPDEDPLDSTLPPASRRPARPLSIEIAAAILIVGGLAGSVGTIGATLGADPAAGDAGARPVIALLLVLNALTVIVGVMVRLGRSWPLAINVVAVLVFIELTAVPNGSAVATLLAALDGFVFVALARNRAWFGWRPTEATPTEATPIR